MYGRTWARYLALFVVVILTWGAGYDSGATLDAYIAPYVTSHDFSGTLFIARGSDVLYQKNVGFADIQAHEAVGMHTRFLVGSIAKTFTAAGIENLARAGKLSYDDPLSRWVPEYRYAGQITLRQLLDHAAGVPDYYSIARFALDRQKRFTLPEIARWLNAFPLDFKPGSHNKYSNSGYSLLALVIERASGSPYAVFLQRRIFDPLGMHDSGAFIAGSAGDLATGYEAAPPPAYLEVSHSIDAGWFVGNGYVYTTATDLSRWLDAANAGTVVNFKSLPYAYGWGVHKEGAYTLLEQSGRIPGFTSYISIDPANGLKVIALSNIQDDAAGKISNDVRALALGAAVATVANRPTFALNPDAMRDYEGIYSLGQALQLGVSIRDGNMFITNLADGIPLFLDATSRDGFFFRTLYVPVSFTRDAQGHVVAMRWNNQFTLEKTPSPNRNSPPCLKNFDEPRCYSKA